MMGGSGRSCAIPEARVLMYEQRVDGTGYQVRGLSATAIAFVLRPLWAGLVANHPSDQEGGEEEELKFGKYKCGLCEFYRAVANLVCNSTWGDNLLKESRTHFRNASLMDPSSLVFQTFEQEVLCSFAAHFNAKYDSEITAIHPAILVKTALVSGDKIAEVRSATAKAVEQAKALGGKKKTLLVVHGLACLEQVVDLKLIESIQGLMLIQDDPNIKSSSLAEWKNSTTGWFLELQKSSTLQKALFLEGSLLDLAKRPHLKDDYNIVFVSLCFIGVQGHERTLEVIHSLCDAFVMVNFCQDPVPDRNQDILEPLRICRTIDTMEAVLKMYRSDKEQGSLSHVLSWFLHKFGLEKVHISEEQTCNEWSQSLKLAGFQDIVHVLEPEQPWPIMILMACVQRPDPADADSLCEKG